MDILILLMISPLLFFIAQFIAKKTKTPPPIFYLIIGVIFGGSANIMHIVGNNDVLPNMANYNMVALWLMFFGAGFNIDLKKLKASGKDTINSAILPVYAEGVILTGVVILLLKVLPIGFELTIPEALFVMITFACSSPANIVPVCMGLNMKGLAGKNRVTDTMLTSSIFDNFTPAPAWIIAVILIASPSMGLELNIIQMIGLVIGVIIALVILCALSKILGEILTKVLSPMSDKVAKNPQDKKLAMMYTSIYFIIIAFLLNFSGPLKTFAVLVVVLASVGINIKEKNKLGALIGFNASMLFAMFGSPVLFSYIGSLIDLQLLFNTSVLVFGIVVTFVAISVKALTIKWILKDEKYTNGERKFAMSCCIPKGVALANFALVFMPIFTMAGVDYVTEFMILLGAMSIVISLPTGIVVLDKLAKKWVTQVDNQVSDTVNK